MITSDIYLGGKCNLNCRFCLEKDVDRFSNEEIFQRIEDIRKHSKSITISGGEPTIREEFFEILDHCLERFETVSLLSNLKSFCDDSFYLKLLERDVSKIEIITSLDSHIESTHDFLCGFKFFKDKIKVLSKINSVFKELIIGIVINNYNLKHLEEWNNFIKQWSDYSVFFKIYNAYGADHDRIIEYMPNYNEVYKIINKIILENKDINYKTAYMPFCKLEGIEKNSIEYDMVSYAIGISGGMEELRNLFLENVFTDKCPDCSYYQYCLGIHRAYIYINGLDDISISKNKF